MTIESIPQAYVVRSAPAAHSLLATARNMLGIAFALWPLTATMLASGALLLSL